MNTLRRTGITILSLALLTGCNREINVKIGLAMPMTGTLAQFGKDSQNGAQVAIDELNAEQFMIGGKRAHFELVVADDKADPEGGKQAAHTLIDAKVNAVFGDYNSGVTIPASPIYAAAGIPQMTVSANSKFTRQGFKTAFRIVADDELQGGILTTMMLDRLHAKSIYLIDDGTTYGVGITDEIVKALAKKNQAQERVTLNGSKEEMATLFAKIAKNKTDLVFYGGDQRVGVPLLKELRKSNSETKFVTSNAMCDQSTIANTEGAANVNFYCTSSGVPPSWLSAGASFIKMYTEKYGPPGNFSPLAYDGVHVFAEAMQNAESSEPEKYLPFLTKGSFDGKIQGPIEFDEKGDLKDATVVSYDVVGGKLAEMK